MRESNSGKDPDKYLIRERCPRGKRGQQDTFEIMSQMPKSFTVTTRLSLLAQAASLASQESSTTIRDTAISSAKNMYQMCC